jgi:16S rRNA (adenine1518-N6/adenine1519-N6)-dimethyltransferase
MQTKTEIQRLLTESGLRPKKRFGQNFLIDRNLMMLLVDSAAIEKNDVVLEVGCATGSLTEELTERCGFVIAVEIDGGLAEIARRQLGEKNNVQIINADILKNKNSINPEVTDATESAKFKYTGRLLLAANLAYNIASPLIINLVTGKPSIDAAFVTIQKEVAERMTASPSEKAYGTLSVILDAAGDCKIIRKLPPSVFWPMPKVESAMVSFIRNKQKIEQIRDISALIQIVGFFMRYRRKMLKAIVKLEGNPEKTFDWQQIFQKCGIDAEKRPDNLRPTDFVLLANTVHNFYPKEKILTNASPFITDS